MPNKLKKALILIVLYLFSRFIKFIALAIFSEKSFDPDSITLFAVEVLLIGFLVFKIKGRKYWAKLILLVIFILNAFSLFISFLAEILSPETVLMSPITAVQFITVILILILLLNKSSDYWFKNSEDIQKSQERKNIRQILGSKYSALIPILLNTFGFIFGIIHERNLGTGTGGLEILFFLFLAPILVLGLIILVILRNRGKKKENQSLIDVSKISLYIISIPISFIIGFFISKTF